MANKKSTAKKNTKKNMLPLIVGAIIIILFAIILTIVSFATSRASSVVGKTYEVDKVKVTLSAEAKENYSKLGISASDLSSEIAKELKAVDLTFDSEKEGIDYTINGSHVTIMGTEYKLSFGKLVGIMDYSDGVTVKVTLKVKK